MTLHTLLREQTFKQPKSEIFAFFSDALNLEKITPDFLRFKILTPSPIAMHAGTLIDYQLQMFKIPFKWRTKIETFEPESHFVDTQVRGPYKVWHHTHEFSSTPNGGTFMKDIVKYEVPLGPFGSIARVLFVKKMVEKIFDYRYDTIAKIFANTL
jgi:ligand-binding SRPBCC domain-containing protein